MNDTTLKPFLKLAAEPVRKVVELKPVKATAKEKSTYEIKAPAYKDWKAKYTTNIFKPGGYDAKAIPAIPYGIWLKANKSNYRNEVAAKAAYSSHYDDVATKAYNVFSASEDKRAKATPSAKDKKQLALTDLIAKYPGAYKGPSARADAALNRIDATGSTALYKDYLQEAKAHPLEGPALDPKNKRAIIALRDMLNSPDFANLPQDVKEQMIEDNYGGSMADLTMGGTSWQDMQNMMRSNEQGGGEDAGAFGTGDVDPVAQSMYSKSYTPGSSSQDNRFGPESAKEIAAIKSERESMKEHDKEKAYRYMNPSAGEYAQTYDNPADQKVYQDQVTKLRTAMKKLGPIVQDNAGLKDYDSFNVYNKGPRPQDFDGFSPYNKPIKAT